jgi:hypothetical protein
VTQALRQIVNLEARADSRTVLNYGRHEEKIQQCVQQARNTRQYVSSGFER